MHSVFKPSSVAFSVQMTATVAIGGTVFGFRLCEMKFAIFDSRNSFLQGGLVRHCCCLVGHRRIRGRIAVND